MYSGRTSCEDEGGHRVRVLPAQEERRQPGSHQKLGERSGTDFSQKEPALLTP